MCLDLNKTKALLKTATDIMKKKKGKRFVGWKVWRGGGYGGGFFLEALVWTGARAGKITQPGWIESSYDPEHPRHKDLGMYLFLTRDGARKYVTWSNQHVVRVTVRREDVIEVGTANGIPAVRVRGVHISSTQFVKEKQRRDRARNIELTKQGAWLYLNTVYVADVKV